MSFAHYIRSPQQANKKVQLQQQQKWIEEKKTAKLYILMVRLSSFKCHAHTLTNAFVFSQ